MQLIRKSQRALRSCAAPKVSWRRAPAWSLLRKWATPYRAQRFPRELQAAIGTDLRPGQRKWLGRRNSGRRASKAPVGGRPTALGFSPPSIRQPLQGEGEAAPTRAASRFASRLDPVPARVAALAFR